ncbi:MAG TPA: hypothetical protein VMD27_11240 [Candidatus Aquilonibacter sp.]|nr:hypothetical protein [Candidatus Aquilonibacter sp.]
MKTTLDDSFVKPEGVVEMNDFISELKEQSEHLQVPNPQQRRLGHANFIHSCYHYLFIIKASVAQC